MLLSCRRLLAAQQASLPALRVAHPCVAGLLPHSTSTSICRPCLLPCLQLKSVFAFCGGIRSCSLTGGTTGCAFMEFTTPQEAGKRRVWWRVVCRVWCVCRRACFAAMPSSMSRQLCAGLGVTPFV